MLISFKVSQRLVAKLLLTLFILESCSNTKMPLSLYPIKEAQKLPSHGHFQQITDNPIVEEAIGTSLTNQETDDSEALCKLSKIVDSCQRTTQRSSKIYLENRDETKFGLIANKQLLSLANNTVKRKLECNKLSTRNYRQSNRAIKNPHQARQSKNFTGKQHFLITHRVLAAKPKTNKKSKKRYLIISLLESQQCITKDGHEITFEKQHCGRLQATVKKSFPAGFTMQTLPVVIEPGLSCSAEMIKNLAWQKQHIYIMKEYVYIGHIGLMGGMKRHGKHDRSKEKVEESDEDSGSEAEITELVPYLKEEKERDKLSQKEEEANHNKTEDEIEVERIESFIAKAVKNAENAQGKDIFLILGKTGAGKSAITNYLLGSKMQLKKDKDLGGQYAITEDPNKYWAEIGHGTEPKTYFPNTYSSLDSKTKHYCDCPGFLEDRLEQDRLNTTTATQIMINSAKSIKVIFVIDVADMKDKAEEMKKIDLVLSHFLSTNIDPKSILFVFNDKNSENKIKLEQIHNKIEDLIKAEKEKLNNPAIKGKERERINMLLMALNRISNNKGNTFLIDILDDFDSKQQIESKLANLEPAPKESFNFSQYYDEMCVKFNQKLYQILSRLLGKILKYVETNDVHELTANRIRSYLNCANLLEHTLHEKGDETERALLKQIPVIHKEIWGQLKEIFQGDSRLLLHRASKRGYVAISQLLIEQGANVNAKDKYGRTPLHCAIIKGHSEIARLLIEKGTDVNDKDAKGNTPLHMAVVRGSTEIANLLLEKGTDVNATDNNGRTPLLLSVLQGSLELAKLLVSKQDKLNAKDIQILIEIAKQKEYKEIVKHLLASSNHIDLNTQNNSMLLYLAYEIDDAEAIKHLQNLNPTYENINNLLFWSAEEGYGRVAKILIQKGADVNAKCPLNFTSLHMAAEMGHLETVKILLEQGADIDNDTNEFNATPLHLAVKLDRREVVKLLIEKKAQINKKDYNGNTPLHIAFQQGFGHIPMMKLLVDEGSDLNFKDKNGNPFLHLVLQKYSSGLLREFIQSRRNVNPNVRDANSNSLLHIAVMKGSILLAKLLLDRNANINDRNNDGMSPLHLAAHEGKLEVAKYLVEKGADINDKNQYRYTPLHYACDKGHLELARYLLEKGADINAKNQYRYAPLHYACKKGDLELARYLVEKGADINAKDQYRYAPLHYACKKGDLELAKCLVEKGADINDKNQYGYTPLHYACKKGDLELARYLVEKEADINAKNQYGYTPLHYACDKGHLEVARYLLEKGADINAKNQYRYTTIDIARQKRYNALVNLLTERLDA